LKTKFFGNLVFVLCAVALITIAYSCKSDDTTVTPSGPDANTINGTVTFTDTNFAPSNGTYIISAYASTAWPPMSGPASYDTLKVTRGTGGQWNAAYSYKLKGLSNGTYVVSVGYKRNYMPVSAPSFVMGIYGCDTSHSMSCLGNPTLKATIANDAGTTGIDFKSVADTTKKIY
jgi:hypothetical protein